MTLQQEDTDTDIFSDPQAARFLPVNYRSKFRGQEALVENVIGDVGQTFKLDRIFAKFDALRGSCVRRVVARVVAMAMDIDVFEPKYGWYVIFKVWLMGKISLTTDIITNDELQSSLWSLANTKIEEVLNEVAGFDPLAVFAFPAREGTQFRLDVALAENLNNMNDF